MIRFGFVAALILLTAVAVLPARGEEQQKALPRGSQLLGVARSDGIDPPFDQHLRGELDKLLPMLQQLNEDAAILIEAYYPGKKGSDSQVSLAFSLAEQVHQYLKLKKSLNHAFFVAIWQDPDEKSKSPKIRLSTYPRDFFEN